MEKSHNECEFGGMCGKVIRNRERLDYIRNVTHATRRLFVHKGVKDWVLEGGSAIGALRCEDVLPWDTDCDVLVDMSAVQQLHQTMFDITFDEDNRPFYDNGTAATPAARSKQRHVDIDDRYTIKMLSACIPLRVIDKHSGYYCDILMSRITGEKFEEEWPYGKTDVTKHGCSSKGYSEPVHDVTPPQKCIIDNEIFQCANDLNAYLKVRYGGSVSKPDVSTYAGKHDHPTNASSDETAIRREDGPSPKQEEQEGPPRRTHKQFVKAEIRAAAYTKAEEEDKTQPSAKASHKQTRPLHMFSVILGVGAVGFGLCLPTCLLLRACR